jgi:hypothetical protein
MNISNRPSLLFAPLKAGIVKALIQTKPINAETIRIGQMASKLETSKNHQIRLLLLLQGRQRQMRIKVHTMVLPKMEIQPLHKYEHY